MSKSRAFLYHLGISGTVVGIVFGIIFFVWYPHPYFTVNGTWSVIRILIGVDLVLGPALTLLVYKPGKRYLRLDMAVIVTVQLTALIYGATVIYQQRPYFTVFAVDRFEVLAESDIDPEHSNIPLEKRLFSGPILAVAKLPEDPKQRQELMFGVLFDGEPDLERRPDLWHAYKDEVDEVKARLNPISDLQRWRNDAESARRIERVLRKHAGQADRLGFAPVIGPKGDFAMIVDTTDGSLLDVIAVDPWIARDEAAESRRADTAKTNIEDPPL